ncbi:MAG: phosphodiester glycosidase family protein [Eubacteriales bacterium]|nr:phosphodiester glycosidase family protein [Eubacteriales bacterium]
MQKKLAVAMLCLIALCFTALGEEAVLHSYDGKYQYVQFGQYPKEEGKAILWRVLKADDENILLLSENIMDFMQAHSDSGSFSDVVKSDIHKYITQDLAQNAFSEEERASFAEGDALSLPAPELLKDKNLGFTTKKALTANATDYAKAKGASSNSRYWMNAVSKTNNRAMRVVRGDGSMGFISVESAGGIRPTLKLNTELVTIEMGTGTKEDPFIFNVTKETIDKVKAEKQAEEERIRQEEEKRLLEEQAEQKRREEEHKKAEKAVEEAQNALIQAQENKASAEEIKRLSEELEAKKEELLNMVSIKIEGFPLLTAEGFLPEGSEEFISVDEEKGEWRYCSDQLRIEILKHERIFEEKRRTRYFTAEIVAPKGTQPFKTYPFHENRVVNRDAYKAKQSDIARKHNLVLAFGADYYIYRTGRPGVKTGVDIRDGQILFDDPSTRTKLTFPPLDMMALYPDGDMKVFTQNELTASELLLSGASDVFSFGPWLIRDGELNESYNNYGYNPNPRVAIGMVEPGHYFLLVAEGRIKPSRGLKSKESGYILNELGCKTAFNLDGGWTSSIIFMGNQLNQLDNNGVHNNARPQNEVIGVGISNKLPEYIKP